MIKTKLKASLIHFIISAFIIGCFLAFALAVWYPAPFFDISGLQHIIFILVTVDVILGPLLTFVVFKSQKTSLKFDLSIIALVQLCAFGYGVHTIYSAHPLYVAYAIDRFTPINTNEVFPEKAKYPELQKSTFSGPTVVYVKKPTDPQEMSRVTMEVLSGKPDLDTRAEYYEPLHSYFDEVLKNGVDPNTINKNEKSKNMLDNFIKAYGKTPSDYAFLPLAGKEKDVLWIWDRSTKQPVDILDISPW